MKRFFISMCALWVLSSCSTVETVGPGRELTSPSNTPEPVAVVHTCITCDIEQFKNTCDAREGGLSTNPDGTISCSFNPSTQSVIQPSQMLAQLPSAEEEGDTIVVCEDGDYCADDFVLQCEGPSGEDGVVSTDPELGPICTQPGNTGGP